MEKNALYKEIVSLSGRDLEIGSVKPKTIWHNSTDLSASYKGGKVLLRNIGANFNFLYNGGDDKATVTMFYFLEYNDAFTDDQKAAFKENLIKAAKTWDGAAAFQLLNINGKYDKTITLKFRVEQVSNKDNANKIIVARKSGKREKVLKRVKLSIDTTLKTMIHELGHVWGARDEYDPTTGRMNLFNRAESLGEKYLLPYGRVSPKSPLLKDTSAIMNEGDEFRARYFVHFGKAIIKAFSGIYEYSHPVFSPSGQIVNEEIKGRIILLKKNYSGEKPYADDQPNNPRFINILFSKKSTDARKKKEYESFPDYETSTSYSPPSANLSKRPSFSVMLKNYPDYNTYTTFGLYAQIGGQFARSALRGKKVEDAYMNSCTVRVSHALNKSGHKIRPIENTVALKGQNGLPIYYKLLHLLKYLRSVFGKPEVAIKLPKPEAMSLMDKKNKLMDRKGIIAFIIDFDDASGHFTLWDGKEIAGGNSSSDYYFQRATEIYLWELA